MNLILRAFEILAAVALVVGVIVFLFGGTKWRSRVSQIAFAVCAAIVLLSLVTILYFVGSHSFQTFTDQHITLGQFFTGKVWNPDNGQVGAVIPIVGTLTVTLLAVLISTPVSVALAVFVTEIAPTWARQFMQPVLELFAGIPSIVYGLLGIELIVPLVRYAYNYLVGAFLYAGFGVVAAGLVLSLMILPTITSISIDAIGSLPAGLREASLALGATRWQTIRRTLIPAGSSGIFTGVILGTGRAIGETLAVAFLVGSNPGSFPIQFTNSFPYFVLYPTSTITVQIFQDFKEATPGSLDFDAVWTLAFVLLLLSLLLVIASRYVASRSAFKATNATRPRGAAKIAATTLPATTV
ncbi:MAG TPA: phosphate ABC transporter permease subunit PstC [Ktedonobacterales bacterium]|nr:phosphate ABC transporter permease subunit PstC [Ktedonobacterales bacterium]